MGNPKFIPTKKKVTYSFRVDEDKLEKLRRLSELKDMKLPQLMEKVIDSYIWDKVLNNTYLEDYEGMFIDLPDITKGQTYDDHSGETYFISKLSFEYEIQQIPNNLDIWDYLMESYRASSENTYEHEGIEFLIVPELCEYEGRCYTDLTKYLYCMYFTVDKKFKVEIEYIPFLVAINKIKKCENYPLLNHALKLKETLEERSEEIESQIYMRNQRGEEVSEFEYVWSALREIAQDFNSGNVIPLDMSRKDIEYKAYVQSINDEGAIDLVSEFNRIKKELSKFGSLYTKFYEYLKAQGLSEEEISEIMNKDKPLIDLSE